MSDGEVRVGPWVRRRRTIAYENPWIRVAHDEVTRPDGTPGVYGVVQMRNAAVAIAVAGAHRDEAFAACRHAIEELKRRVPIWKRERYADGTVEWVGAGAAADLTVPGGRP